MMNVIPVALGIAVGISLFAGLLFLIIGLSRRPRDWTNVTFALMSLSIAGNTISVLTIHTARSVDEYVIAFKFGFGLTSLLAIITLMWFVAFYSAVKPRRFLLGMSLWFTLIIVFGLIFLEEKANLAGEAVIEMALIATVLLSIYSYGISAYPAINKYAQQVQSMGPDAPEKQDQAPV